ncbi:MAG: exo-alpha-sialidase [Clostridia bacterium]|nr:exo-alpha-sialidase [Clostridia bacterium]
MKHGIVGRTAEGFFRYQAWPTVCKDENGVLYVGASGHRLGHICPFGKDLLYISNDEGKTWSAPMIINDTALDDRDAGLTSLGDGKLLLTYFNWPRESRYYLGNPKNIENGTHPMTYPLTYGMLKVWETMPDEANHGGSFVRLSKDSGKTWGKAVKVPVSSPHGPIKLSNGKLLFLGKEYYSGEYEQGAIFAFESSDDGATWQYLAQIDFPDGCNKDHIHEPDCVELPDGRILGALRGQGSPVAYGFSVFTCMSEDGGKTWTHPKALDICGSPPHLFLHSSGAVVMTYARRRAPYAQCARISYDGGETFGEEIVLRDDGPDADLGYPSTVELSDGSLMTVYYQKAAGDSFCSILYTVWDLPQK